MGPNSRPSESVLMDHLQAQSAQKQRLEIAPSISAPAPRKKSAPDVDSAIIPSEVFVLDCAQTTNVSSQTLIVAEIFVLLSSPSSLASLLPIVLSSIPQRSSMTLLRSSPSLDRRSSSSKTRMDTSSFSSLTQETTTPMMRPELFAPLSRIKIPSSKTLLSLVLISS